MSWHRHDWPAPVGYQIEDSFVGANGSPETIWSYPPFGSFVAANGDGGEVYSVATNDTVTITERQDGGKPGIQRFCGGTGWIVFEANPPSGSWASTVATLADVPAGSVCPATLNSDFTQWRLEQVAVPFIINSARQSVTVATIISEHYDAATIATSRHLERTFFGQGYGRLIWESWGLTAPTINLSARCPGTAYSTPPAPGWQLEDCRYLTNIVSSSGTMTDSGFGWP